MGMELETELQDKHFNVDLRDRYHTRLRERHFIFIKYKYIYS